MSYFLYARKSTDSEDRQVLSIEAQFTEVREFAKKEGLPIVAEFIESMTAKEPGRPVFNEMLTRIEQGEAKGIIAWNPDRLARNSVDGGRIIYFVDTGKIKNLKFPTFRFDNNAYGKFILSIAFGQSKYYTDNLSENIRRGIRQKLRKGIWPQWAPLGYLNDHKTKTIIIDKEKAPFIKKAFDLYATGDYSIKTIKTIVHEKGLMGKKDKPLSASNVQYLLKNPVYYCCQFSATGCGRIGFLITIIPQKLHISLNHILVNLVPFPVFPEFLLYKPAEFSQVMPIMGAIVCIGKI